MIPSFVDYLVENGYTYSDSMHYSTLVFNDLPLPDEVDFLYWKWSNKYIVPQCMKGEK